MNEEPKLFLHTNKSIKHPLVINSNELQNRGGYYMAIIVMHTNTRATRIRMGEVEYLLAMLVDVLFKLTLLVAPELVLLLPAPPLLPVPVEEEVPVRIEFDVEELAEPVRVAVAPVVLVVLVVLPVLPVLLPAVPFVLAVTNVRAETLLELAEPAVLLDALFLGTTTLTI